MEAPETKAQTIISAVVVAALVIAAVGTTFITVNRPNTQSTTAPAQTNTSQQNNKTVRFTAEKGKTVLDQLKSRAQVEVKDTQYGPFVESINGVKGGSDGKYWSYYVNDTLAQKGAGEYITEGGENIEWKFE